MPNNISDDNNQNPDNRFVANAGVPIPKTPTPTCFHHHHLHPDHVAVGSPVNNRVPPRPPPPPPSSSSSATPFSNGFFFSPYSPSPNSDHCSTKFWFDSDDSSIHNKLLHDDLGLCNDFSNINISLFDQYHNNNCSFNETETIPFHHVANNVGLFGKGFTFNTPMEPSLSHDHTYQYHLPDHRKKPQQQGNNSNYHLLCDRFMASQQGVDCEASWNIKNPFRLTHPNLNAPSHYYAKESGSIINPELSPRVDPAGFRCNNSFILQGKDVKHCIDNRYNSIWGEAAIQAKNFSPISENNANFPQPMMLNLYSSSLAEVQGHIYKMAKDQNGCRFLQRMVDEGTYEDMCVVFEGIIGNVVELMMDSFGNYLVQKLLDVCSEDQRLQIVFMLTKVPGQLVNISLNTHGTRVVQKLIETLNSAKQISLVKSAIQPGFLDLIKDLNGNHVIQRCLQCLSCQDNQFIFEAAVKFCVDIATHRHGCCVLQRCIDHSVGKQRDKLVTEICKHGLFLAQDPFGNYVVQYIIEVEAPTASAKLLGQFRGNYVNLSTQKFSSHVVEKCLKHIGDSRSRIVRELLSAPHFEQLLQDPYANYVIQSALSVTKGSLHASLVEAVRPHKILRTSPYCKRIFSGSLLKK